MVDEWVRSGITHAVVSPGSRSTPMALALKRSNLMVHVKLDERSGAFFALGLAKATDKPVVILTTSGTAAAELLPAVVEAYHSLVPLIVLTADRPNDLRGIGQAQTIEQASIYGGFTRWRHDLGIADLGNQHAWRSIASRAVAESSSSPSGAGPVHLNLQFREPLTWALEEVRSAGLATEGRAGGAPWHRVLEPDGAGNCAPGVAERLVHAREMGARGVIIAGERSCRSPEDSSGLYNLAAWLGWPILADPISGLRSRQGEIDAVANAGTEIDADADAGTEIDADADPVVITFADAMLRKPEFAATMRPEIVIRFGRPWASKVVAGWLSASGASQFQLSDCWDWSDPYMTMEYLAITTAGRIWAEVSRQLGLGLGATKPDETWLRRWGLAEQTAAAAIENAVKVAGGDRLTEPEIAKAVASSVPSGGAVFMSSSMPVRDMEWFSGLQGKSIEFASNRGVNGIDGVVSSGLGFAGSGRFSQVAIVVGELAFLHDLSSVLSLCAKPRDLPHEMRIAIVVIDNGGGGIFSFLPQAGSLSEQEFGELFSTPQALSITDLLVSQGITVHEVRTRTELDDAILKCLPPSVPSNEDDEVAVNGIVGEPVAVIVCKTEGASNVSDHDRIISAVASALENLS